MASLLIDIGNTALKASWADGMTLGKTFRYQGERMVEFILSLTSKERPELIVLSSVRYFSEQNVERLRRECDRMLIIDSEMLESRYGIPACLTPDRAASVIAAGYLFKGRPSAVSIHDEGNMPEPFIDLNHFQILQVYVCGGSSF